MAPTFSETGSGWLAPYRMPGTWPVAAQAPCFAGSALGALFYCKGRSVISHSDRRW